MEYLTATQQASRRYYLKNKKLVKDRNKANVLYQQSYRVANRDKAKEVTKKWAKENKNKIEKYLEKNAQRLKANRVIYNKANRKRQMKNFLKKYHSDPQVRILHLLRSRLGRLVKKKESSTITLLGCTIQRLKEHLESQFQEGMKWENQGKGGWHIDHKLPCSSFDLTQLDQQEICFHYTNLQPLWEEDNLKKVK